MALTFGEVSEILKIIDGSDLDELVLEIGDTRLVVRKGPTGSTQTALASRPDGAKATAGTATAASASTDVGTSFAPNERSKPEPPIEGAVLVESTMVGRAFRRPSPEEPPYVEVGQTVVEGETLCLIEVMKLFTAIASPVSGEIVEILFEDGGAVEYDQPLIWIKPS